MSVDSIRNLLREVDHVLDSLERDLSDLEDERDELQEAADHEDFIGELHSLIDLWYRLDVKDPEGSYAVHAKALETIVDKYQGGNRHEIQQFGNQA